MAVATGRPWCLLQPLSRPCLARSLRKAAKPRSKCCKSFRAPQLSTVADPDEGGGTSTIERPDLLREGSSIINLTDAGFGNVETKEDKKLGGGNYRVLRRGGHHLAGFRSSLKCQLVRQPSLVQQHRSFK
ncbi:hypothetical protein WJX74_007505 [Apatococcus lobatus]|uniref:Uncharacterized protein n=2 Tax=Apatococcus TaxID=904362 RepID=A0AAW1THG7_9CHLO